MRVWVDGYNLIRCSPLAGLERNGLEPARERLIELLRQYRRRRGHDIVVVFDGRDRRGGLPRNAGAVRAGTAARGAPGVRVVYAASADDAIVAAAQPGMLVVSSDSELCRRAEQAGATCAPADVFWRRLREALGEAPTGAGRHGRVDDGDDAKFRLDETEEDEPPDPRHRSGRRLSKAERRRQAGLRRL